jgi:hypothetical protein
VIWRLLGRWLIVGAILALPVAGYAQEAVITGTVTDTTAGVLPGVTVTALHEATGNTFVAVTNERGVFRIAARVGTFRLTFELPGFTTVTQSGLELLVGQTADLRTQMNVTTVQETVTVTGEAPLLDTTGSSLGGNIDPRQMSELPVQGRNWTALALLAPGNRTTAMGAAGTVPQPVEDRQDVRDFQVNMDGMQVTNLMGPGGQPRYSRDTIAEFQFISNRFDATQGRSAGAQVNAITRSGTNTFAGSFGGYFRNSRWNSEDHVLRRVVPYRNQQYSTTVGGPILRDRLHFFGNYEYEREPRTQFANTGFPRFNLALTGTNTTHMGGSRFDYQISQQNRMMVKWNLSEFQQAFANLGSNHPQTAGGPFTTKGAVGQLTQVLSNRAMNQLQIGWAHHSFSQKSLTSWSNHPMAAQGITNGGPRIIFTGFQIAGGFNVPQTWSQNVTSARDEFTISYTAKGTHDLKLGGEFLWDNKLSHASTRGMGEYDARGGPIPSNIEDLFPVWNNADTWNLAAISPIVRRYILTVGKRGNRMEKPMYGGWIQDDWRVNSRLTLNLGLRYDLIWDAFTNQVEVLPWIEGRRPQDADNFQPRVGFAYQLDDRTVLRGGTGKYYGEPLGSAFSWTMRMRDLIYIAVPNDGRPNFAANPFNGPIPTYEQAYARLCHVTGLVPGCYERDGQELAPPAEYAHLNQAWQTSIGVQRQLAGDMVFEVDYNYSRNRDEKVIHDNANLTYNQATGVNYPFSNRARRFYPEWGAIGYFAHNGYSNYHGMQTAFTKRFGNRWQASANYLLSGLRNVGPAQPLSGHAEVPFAVLPDLGNEYGLALTDQRHRAVFNGIWQVAGGFQVSGLYFYGSGQRFSTNCGGDRRDIGAPPQHYVPRLCADGSIVPRNSFVGEPVHRVDARFQQRIPLFRSARIDGILEMFNLVNKSNYGLYVTDRAHPRYGQPDASTDLAYAPRTVTLGFRATF